MNGTVRPQPRRRRGLDIARPCVSERRSLGRRKNPRVIFLPCGAEHQGRRDRPPGSRACRRNRRKPHDAVSTAVRERLERYAGRDPARAQRRGAIRYRRAARLVTSAIPQRRRDPGVRPRRPSHVRRRPWFSTPRRCGCILFAEPERDDSSTARATRDLLISAATLVEASNVMRTGLAGGESATSTRYSRRPGAHD